MEKLTKKQKWFKKIILTKKDQVYVGLDVHKRSISVAIWINGQVEITFNMPADYPRLTERLKLLKKALKMVVYEAGLIRHWDFVIHSSFWFLNSSFFYRLILLRNNNKYPMISL